jgi:hypothetical protein
MASKSIEKMTKAELVSFLREKEKRCSGSKQDLLDLARIYVKSNTKTTVLISKKDEKKFEEERDIFFNPSKDYSDVANMPKLIPSGFNIDVIHSFLTEVLYQLDGEDEATPSGTAKPAIKGRHMYASSKAQFCEYHYDGSNLLFRATIEASMEKNCL